MLTQKTYHVENYLNATKAKSFIKFTNSSKELWLLTHTYSGYALDFKVQYLEDKQVMNEIKVDVPVASIDTDKLDRNKKMKEFCLEQNNFPYITVTLLAPVRTDGVEQNIPGKINIRGLDKPINLKIKVEGHLVSGSAKLSFKELEIPDPSIAVAKIFDEIKLDFNLDLDQ